MEACIPGVFALGFVERSGNARPGATSKPPKDRTSSHCHDHKRGRQVSRGGAKTRHHYQYKRQECCDKKGSEEGGGVNKYLISGIQRASLHHRTPPTPYLWPLLCLLLCSLFYTCQYDLQWFYLTATLSEGFAQRKLARRKVHAVATHHASGLTCQVRCISDSALPRLCLDSTLCISGVQLEPPELVQTCTELWHLQKMTCMTCGAPALMQSPKNPKTPPQDGPQAYSTWTRGSSPSSTSSHAKMPRTNNTKSTQPTDVIKNMNRHSTAKSTGQAFAGQNPLVGNRIDFGHHISHIELNVCTRLASKLKTLRQFSTWRPISGKHFFNIACCCICLLLQALHVVLTS